MEAPGCIRMGNVPGAGRGCALASSGAAHRITSKQPRSTESSRARSPCRSASNGRGRVESRFPPLRLHTLIPRPGSVSLPPKPSRTPTQTRVWPLLRMSEDFWADYATGRADRNLKWGERCVTSSPGGPLGCCPRSRRVSRGEGGRGRGGGDRRRGLKVLTAPRRAWECPYKAHVRMLSGSVVPDGLRGGWRVQGPHIAHVRVVARSASRVLRSRTARPRSHARVT